MNTAEGSTAATSSGQLPVGSRPKPGHQILWTLAVASMVGLGTGVGFVLAVIIGMATGIIPFIC
jgi:hypothetical protein